MSNITFMIGNGFDVACGLNSKYTDTYDGYVNSPSSSDTIEQFKQQIEKDIPTWSDFEMQLIKYAASLSSANELTTCLRDYDKYLNDYLAAEQAQFWRNLSYKESMKPILQEMARSLIHFFDGLTPNDSQMIRNVVVNSPRINYRFISFNYTNILDRFLNDIVNHQHILSELPLPYSLSEVLHIHGILGGDVTLGVDNETQLEKIPYNIPDRAKRVLIKPFFLKSYDNRRLEKALEIVLNSDIICVFGLSLGDSDMLWRTQIAKWLKSENHHLVYYKHSNMKKQYHSTAVTTIMDDEEDCKEELLSMLYNENIEENTKVDIFNRVHMPVGVSIFDMKTAMAKARIIERGHNKTNDILSLK